MNGQVLRADGEDLFGNLIKAKCAYIILGPRQQNSAWQLFQMKMERCEIKQERAEIQSERMPLLVSALFCNVGFYERLCGWGTFMYEDGNPQDVVTIFTTSGSTGYSKLVPRTHQALLTTAFFANQSMALKPGRHCFNCAPLGWTGGYPLLYLFTGCTRIAIDDSFGVAEDKTSLVWDIMCKEDINVALMPQPLLTAVCDRKRRLKAELKLPQIFTRGQPIKRETLSVLKELTHPISIAYGSTELGLVSELIIDLKNTDMFENFMVGRPFKGINVKIVNKELNNVPFLTKGEILVQSPTLCSEYIGESQDSFLPDGWFRTGDIGFQREDGCLFVEGRSSEAIMHGSYILYPTWLEQKLVACPGVKEVVIVPVPDKRLYHEICACVKLDDTTEDRPTADDIVSFCRSQVLLEKSSSLNVSPKYVLFLNDYPLTVTNKLDRRKLATIAKDQLSL